MPSSCSTTITSMAPVRVAGFSEFHVVHAVFPMFLTYCMISGGDVEVHGERKGQTADGLSRIGLRRQLRLRLPRQLGVLTASFSCVLLRTRGLLNQYSWILVSKREETQRTQVTRMMRRCVRSETKDRDSVPNPKMAPDHLFFRSRSTLNERGLQSSSSNRLEGEGEAGRRVLKSQDLFDGAGNAGKLIKVYLLHVTLAAPAQQKQAPAHCCICTM